MEIHFLSLQNPRNLFSCGNYLYNSKNYFSTNLVKSKCLHFGRHIIYTNLKTEFFFPYGWGKMFHKGFGKIISKHTEFNLTQRNRLNRDESGNFNTLWLVSSKAQK